MERATASGEARLGPLGRVLALGAPYVVVGGALYLARSAWAAMFGYQALMLLLLWWARGRRGAGRPERGRPKMLLVLLALASAVAAGPAVFVLWPWIGSMPQLGPHLGALGVSGSEWWLLFACFMAVNPWLEELYWRGLLLSPARWPCVEDVCFAGYHALVLFPIVRVGWVLAAFGSLVLAAWLWRRLRLASGSLAWPITSHALADLSVLLAATALR